jgi:hypothetical protein
VSHPIRRPTAFRLLDAFAATFQGRRYLHRNSQIGNRIADYLFDDLILASADSQFRQDCEAGRIVLNPKGIVPGVVSRRGDGSVGPLVPGHVASPYAGHLVSVGSNAEVDLGAEVKILAKAMIKQIDRVNSDLCGQATHLRAKSPDAITVGIVGLNFADHYVSYERDRSYPTGEYGPHPNQEASEAERRLIGIAQPCFNEFLIFRFRATNVAPYPFEWVAMTATQDEYAAALIRLLRAYERSASRPAR